MGRLLTIDYGIKRTGLAVTDELQIIATALTTVETPKLMAFIDDYTRSHAVDAFVVGDPRHMDNTPSESAVIIEPFVEKLRAKYPDTPIHRMDERFTSKMAFQSMIDGGLGKKKRRDKGMIDAVSAVLILQNFMQLRENRK